MRRLIWLIPIAGWAAVLVRVFLTANDYQGDFYKIQWDFDVYYYAAKAHVAGLNPYDPSLLRDLSGVGDQDPRSFHFPYLPISLFLFKPFTWLSLEYASYAYFFIKCGLLAYLFYLWQIKFLENPSDPFFAIFCLLAFNAAIFLDIQSGNVSIIEQTLIWSALVGFVTRKMWHFCIFVLLAGIFKVTPIMLAGLLLLDRPRLNGRWVFVLFCGFIILGFVNWVTAPALFRDFFVNAPQYVAGGQYFYVNITNPSILSLVTFVVYEAAGILLPTEVQWCLHVACVIPILLVSWHAFRRLDAGDVEHRKIAICLACLVYALVLPRFQDYQWILLLVPTYFIMLRLDFVRAYPAIFVLAVLSAEHQTLPGSASVFRVFWNYYPLLVALTVWALYVMKILRDFASAASQINTS